MADRDTFLARVRAAAAQGRPYRVHLRDVPEHVGYLGASGDLCEQFAAEVNAVGGQALLVADLAAARDALRRLLQETSARCALCWKHELLDRLGLADLLAAQGIARCDYDELAKLPAEKRRPLLLACDVGVTSCDGAIAETGTLVMCSRPGQERVASLLPPVHVAIIQRRQLVPDLIDALARLGSASEAQDSESTLAGALATLPSNVTFITGPSKTGDIELQLTTGVHGPGKWCVIVIR